MKYGDITCTCGQDFSFETFRNTISCIKCNEIYDVSDYPELEEETILSEGTEPSEAGEHVSKDSATGSVDVEDSHEQTELESDGFEQKEDTE